MARKKGSRPVAIAHFDRTVYKSGSKLATGRITYISGAQASVPAEARIEHQGLAARTRQPREDVVLWGHRNLPSWANDSPIAFFRAAERYEGANRVAYTEFRCSLPRELSRELYLEAAHDLLEAFFGEKHPYVYAIHDPPASDGGNQPHLHVLFSARITDGSSRSAATHFKLYQAKAPERGGAHKDPAMNHMGAVFAARQLYCDLMNLHLERHGHAARLNPHRLEARGIERSPEPRLKPSDSNARKHHGEITRRMADVERHRTARRPTDAAEQRQARHAWNARKRALGITPDTSHADALARMRAAREARASTPPDRGTPDQQERDIATLAAEAARLARLEAALRVERHIEDRLVAQGKDRPQDGKRRLVRLLAERTGGGLPRKVLPVSKSARIARATQRLLQAQQGHEGHAGEALHVQLTEDETRRTHSQSL